LNYVLEADHAAAFGQMFAGDLGIYIPRVYREHSTRRVLTLEDVTTIKVSDYSRLEAEGVDRLDVARRLISTYLWMVFIQRFFHADPHPGNLFVFPLPPDIPAPQGRHRDTQPMRGCPFYLIFVDFGMVGRLTPEIVSGLRETLIALGTRDAKRLVASYQRLGILLPGADLDRIEAAARAAFDRVWGLNMSELSRMPFSDMVDLGREFSDLLFKLPFQVPQDFLYLARAVGILSGICTGLDPQIDPWHEMQPFVRSLAAEDGEAQALGIPPLSLNPLDWLRPQTLRSLLAGDGVVDLLLETGRTLARRTVQLPALADDVLRRADRGDLVVRAEPTPPLQRQLDRIEGAVQRIAGAVIFSGLALSSTLLYVAGEHTLGTAGFALAGMALLKVLLGGRVR
jgi:hypothetical protein